MLGLWHAADAFRIDRRVGFAGVLFAGLLVNWLTDATRAVLERLDLAEHKPELST